MSDEPREWLCVGPFCCEATSVRGASAGAVLRLVRRALRSRVKLERWIRYDIELAHTPPAPAGVHLTPVTDEIIRALRTHPDHSHNQLRSGFKFWDHGLRHAYIWIGEDGPLCIQWLLTPAPDNPRLHTLAEWAGMYPPIPRGQGQVENLFAFSNVRKKGVATQFEYALYEEARRAGIGRLITHIHEANGAARGWAARTGWRAYGTITRYLLDLPGLRGCSVYVHRTDEGLADSVSSAEDVARTSSPVAVT
jgi:GNAT superfamily N-acetyltransferase